MRMTIRTLNKLILDEKHSSEMYEKYGLHSLARDEKNHEMFLREVKARYKERMGQNG